ncbi:MULTISPECIES: hypothetical protein [Nostoc]|uniref:Transposase n=1 Tax=Nostoc paludosum FACHB-159 TaxID=2692908 RepID=A0ABR8KEK9_9NOSO|nr:MULTISPECIES: hypothetical protein [Nostoc]MBD2681544.1 hypothetical protein [Nostoc sp. FACHB-857]MBD2738004.1 hypothetical protein [Nostoc paludosum FACHB-159]
MRFRKLVARSGLWEKIAIVSDGAEHPKVRKSRREFLSFICHSRDLSVIFQANAVHLYCAVGASKVRSHSQAPQELRPSNSLARYWLKQIS